MNTYLIIILIFYVSIYFLETIIELLNISNLESEIPEEFRDIYKKDDYKKSQNYLKETTRFSLLKTTFFTLATLYFILIGGFNYLDIIIRNFNFGPLITGVLYIQLLIGGLSLVSIPFSLYSTFYLEKKYGFNKTSLATYFLDFIKSTVLTFLIGSPVIYALLWFFNSFNNMAWLYAWTFLVITQLIIMYIAPTYIMPLFNKFIPLEEGELKSKIETYAKQHKFELNGLYKMDGSKRSTKSNAFFTGFGKNKRIVLFDTLINKHSSDELLCILAHEMGHYKLNHIQKGIIISIFTTGFMLFLLSLFLNNPQLSAAFKLEKESIYTSLVVFGFLFKPIEEIISILNNILSRKHEYEADEYAIKTTGLKLEFITGLKKLSVDNLSNLKPHWLKVFIEYSHPPLLNRINAIKKI
jgi:STE24 endopeptidase